MEVVKGVENLQGELRGGVGLEANHKGTVRSVTARILNLPGQSFRFTE